MNREEYRLVDKVVSVNHMKKKIPALILIMVTAFSISGCGSEKTPGSGHEESGIVLEDELSKEGLPQEKEEAMEESKDIPEGEDQTGTAQNVEVSETASSDFSFEDLKNLEFLFASGAGGWGTVLTIHPDGSFQGEHFDGDLGDTGDGYPNGTAYQCIFSGQFTQPEKVNDYTYSMQISELTYAREAGSEEIKDGVRYIYSSAYGLANAENILIYLPGAPLAELSEDFRSWVGYHDLSRTTDTELPFYALNVNDKAEQYGFSSYDVIENLKQYISYMEEKDAAIQNSLINDPLNQLELNEKSKELYDLWDSALNEVWGVLKQTKDEKTMRLLTEEEREWIAKKEQTVAEAGEAYAGGTMQGLIINEKAAEMTKARVYELMEEVFTE